MVAPPKFRQDYDDTASDSNIDPLELETATEFSVRHDSIDEDSQASDCYWAQRGLDSTHYFMWG